MNEHWFEDRFKCGINGWSLDNDIKSGSTSGPDDINKHLRDSFNETSYAKENYVNVEQLLNGLAAHTNKQEERLTQIFVWILSQHHHHFKKFNEWFVKGLQVQYPDFSCEGQTLYWESEFGIPVKKEIDIVATKKESSKNPNDVAIAIECKIDSDFSAGQMLNYASWLKTGLLAVILKHYKDLKSVRQEIKEYADITLLEPIYWSAIYVALEKIESEILREDLKAAFKQNALDLEFFSKVDSTKIDHTAERNNLCRDIDKIIKKKIVDENFSVKQLPAGQKKGFFQFAIHPNNEKGDGRTFFYSPTSCHICVEGFLPQGPYTANQKTTSSQLLSIWIIFCSECPTRKLSEEQETQMKQISERLKKGEWKPYSDPQPKKVNNPTNKFVAVTFPERLKAIDEQSINSYMEKLEEFLKQRITEYIKSVNEK